jgi:hypothetical protein
MSLERLDPQANGRAVASYGDSLSGSLVFTLERWFLYGASQLGLRPIEPDPDLMANTRFLRVEELSHTADLGQSFHSLNMQNVLSSFRDGAHSVVFFVSGQGGRTSVCLGLAKFDPDSQAQTADHIEILKSALYGNYPGIRLTALSPSQVSMDILRPVANLGYVGAITGIPSRKDQEQGGAGVFVQGLERLTNSLRGEEYSLVVIAEPISEMTVEQVIQRCRDLGSEIHAYVNVGRTVTDTRSEERGLSIGAGIILGGSSTLASVLGLGPLMTIASPFLENILAGAGLSVGGTDTSSRAVHRDILNKTAEFCERTIDRYIERLQEGKNLGFWNVGTYLLARNENALRRAQGVARAVLSGDKTYFEPLRGLDFSDSCDVLRDALVQFRNPEINFPNGGFHPLGTVFQKLATPMNTAELSLIVNFPREEVPGIAHFPTADFGLNPPIEEGFDLGRVIYRGEILQERFRISPKSLTKHTFISGITGAGKTNTCLALLRAAYEGEQVPFLVIEPAKQEYRALLADPKMGKNLQVFTLGDETVSPFRINPFHFAHGYSLLTHIDLLKAVFNASFPMYASMPYILEEAILDVYTNRGWDLASSRNHYIDVSKEDYTAYLPTLQDLYNQIDVVVERKKYAQRLSMDISAALKARIKSLLVGGKGLMLNCPRTYPLELLFEKPTVMELKHVGDDSEKAFLMALVLINLYEYCETSRNYSGGLQHITLFEESHRLLKNIPPSMSAEGANPRGKAVEMFSDILSEIREYGEGFIIVDQVPAKLTPDALKNTNLKILHRVVAADDRESVGNAMNLTLEQKEHVVRLRVGQAVLHNEYLDNPVLVQINFIKDNLRDAYVEGIGEDGLRERMTVLHDSVCDIHRRWPGCAHCDSPCRYFSELNAPGVEEYETFQRFLDILLVGEPRTVPDEWVALKSALLNWLDRKYHGAQITPGILYCHIVQLVHRTLWERLGYYRGGRGGYRSFIKLEELLLDVVSGMMGADTLSQKTWALIEVFRREMFDYVAVEPHRLEAGCQLCKHSCWFGFIVQRDLPPKARKLAECLKVASQEPGFVGNYTRLVEVVEGFSQDVTSFLVHPNWLHPLAFCYLVNSGGRRQHILRGFQDVQ